jgi:hypothetical protein
MEQMAREIPRAKRRVGLSFGENSVGLSSLKFHIPTFAAVGEAQMIVTSPTDVFFS